jgi:hypothetical protein
VRLADKKQGLSREQPTPDHLARSSGIDQP